MTTAWRALRKSPQRPAFTGRRDSGSEMRRQVARVYHATTAVFLLCMDVLYFFKVVEVFSVRTDLFHKHFLGLGLQFFTVWSQAALQIYFFATFASDLIEPTDHDLLKQIKRVLRVFNAVFFTSVLVPVSILVTVNYWTLNSLLDPNLIEDTQVLQKYVPAWMDHTLHTNVLFFTLAELLLCYRPYPRWRTLGRLRSLIVVLAYTSWVTFAVMIGSAWPYPFMRMMTVAQRLGFLLVNCGLAMWSYTAGDVINTAVWGKRNKIV